MVGSSFVKSTTEDGGNRRIERMTDVTRQATCRKLPGPSKLTVDLIRVMPRLKQIGRGLSTPRSATGYGEGRTSFRQSGPILPARLTNYAFGFLT